MTSYKGKPAVIGRPIGELYERFSNLSFLQGSLDKLPPEELAKVGELKFDNDSLTIVTPQMGEIRFEVTERTAPSRVAFAAAGSPVPMGMTINLKELSPEETEVSTAIELEIPAVMRAFVGPKLQQAADKFGELMNTLGK